MCATTGCPVSSCSCCRCAASDLFNPINTRTWRLFIYIVSVAADSAHAGRSSIATYCIPWYILPTKIPDERKYYMRRDTIYTTSIYTAIGTVGRMKRSKMSAGKRHACVWYAFAFWHLDIAHVFFFIHVICLLMDVLMTHLFHV